METSNSLDHQFLLSLKARFPCRKEQIGKLALHISHTSVGNTFLFIDGPPATGKTAIVSDLFSGLSVPYAYIDGNESRKVPSLLSLALFQLGGNKRSSHNGYATSCKCDSMADFLLQLPDVLNGREGWLIIDNAHRLASTSVLSSLSRTREATDVNLRLLVISSVGWGTGIFLQETCTLLDPIQIRFPPYRPSELKTILVSLFKRKHQEQVKFNPSVMVPQHSFSESELLSAYRSFVDGIMNTFARASVNLRDASAFSDEFFPQYIAPLLSGKKLAPENGFLNRNFFSNKELGRAIKSLDVRAHECRDVPMKKSSEDMGLPYVSKYLLLAAYIASWNSPSSDRQVFDGAYKIKRGRKNGQASDRAAESALEAELRGPHSFPLERLLHIFYNIYNENDEDSEYSRKTMEGAEVLMQITTLCTLRLLAQSGGTPFEGQTYRCLISKQTAEMLAKNVKLALYDYIRLGM